MIKKTLNAIGMPSNLRELWDTGIGVLSNNNIMSTQVSILGGALLANIPQVVLSYIYVFFNGMLTSMLIGEEWSNYFLIRKPLRVSSPVGSQRSTYWLQVPYRYSIPLMIVSGLLHWLSSESLFLVLINHFNDESPRNVGFTTSTLGFSPVAIIFATLVGVFYLVFGISLALRKYPKGMPLAGSCSALISASCHPPKEDVDVALLPVQWGAVKGNEESSGKEKDMIGHCTFTSLAVETPIEGSLYT
jgi:hypothetical protein